MSETQPETNESTQDGNTTSGDTSAAGDDFKPITSQEDFEVRLKDRLNRERAKFSDYKDLRAKASRLDLMEESTKTDLQKANERREAAERERDEARVEGLRFKVAAKYGVSEDDADLFLTANDEQTLTKQAQRLTERVADRKKQGNFSPREGTNSPSLDSDEREVARALFGR